MTKLVTADDLFVMPDDNHFVELVRGEIRRSPLRGAAHGECAGHVARPLLAYAHKTGAGVVFLGNTGLILARDPDTVRAPDLIFVRSDALPPPPRPFYLDLVPTLVVEVVPSSVEQAEVMEKVEEYRAADIPHIWVVFPKARTVLIDGAGREPVTLSMGEAIDPGDVLPDMKPILLAEIFRER
jgi:Uma2 family endonuclease